jgi:protein-arginine kinase activator protein McsA
MTTVDRFLIWAGLKTATHTPEGQPIIALDCGHEHSTYARSIRTSRTACTECYHAMVNGKGSRGF